MNIARMMYRVVISLWLVVVLMLIVLLAGVRLVGLTPYTVISGSMEPTYPVGSLLYVQKVDPTSLRTGDPITYYAYDGMVVTHRVVEVLETSSQGIVYRTKGDANNVEDPMLVTSAQVIGRPLFHIPKLGYLADFVQSPAVIGIAVAAVVVMLSLGALMNERFPQERKDQENSNCASAH